MASSPAVLMRCLCQYQLNIDDLNVDEETEEFICCPAGHAPESSVHDKQTAKTKTIMPQSTCGQCEYIDKCPVNAPNRVRKGQCGRVLALFYAFDKENRRTNRPERSKKEFFGVPTAIYRVSTILCCGLKQLLTLASILALQGIQ